jgi:hypothetical protein
MRPKGCCAGSNDSMPGGGAEGVRPARAGAVLAALAFAAAATAQTGFTPPAAGTGDAPAAPWRTAGLPQQAFAPTRYAVVEREGRRVLRIDAEASYGNLVHDLGRILPAGTALAWRWNVERFADGTDLRRKAGDDVAAKVCVLWDLPLDRVPFVERQLLRLARNRTGEALPAATLCYVWDAALPAGTLLDNAYSRRVRLLVLRGAGDAAGRWQSERRDLAADFLRAFGDEARGEVPPVLAIAVGADADNTRGRSTAFVDGPELVP